METDKEHQGDRQDRELALLRAELTDSREQYHEALLRLEALEKQYEAIQREYSSMSNSFSWKLTKPVRVTLDRLKFRYRNSRKAHAVWSALKDLKHRRYRDAWNSLSRAFAYREYALAPCYTRAEQKAQRTAVFTRDIKFSIAVPLYNTPEDLLKEMIGSVRKQTYANWELCLADGSDGAHEGVGRICREFAEKDPRICYRKLENNMGISGNTNACLDMATGDYIALLDHDDLLHPSALYEVMKAICEQDADFVYTDENTFRRKPSDAYCPHFKPDYAPDTLRANNYICHFTVFKRSLLDIVGGFRSEYDGSQDYDMVLRLTEQAEKIVHIPKILYYWRACQGSVAEDIAAKPYVVEAGRKSVEAHLERVGLPGQLLAIPQAPTIYRVRYAIRGEPLISILIPNCDHLPELEKCIRSIYERSGYTAFEILIIENNSRDPKTFAFYERMEASHPNFRVLYWKEEFNYSAINNFGRQSARGAYILLLNNDTEVISPDWIQEMLMFAQRSDVGAVGAKLYYPDDTVQHGGVIVGIGGIAGHAFKGVPRDHFGYMGRLLYAQNLSAVTGACLMMRAEVWDEVGGLDPSFPMAFNDVDLCLRIRQAGYRIVWTPFAELYHDESKSRGADTTPEKKLRFEEDCRLMRERWNPVIQKGDPYYNPNFSLDREDFYIP